MPASWSSRGTVLTRLGRQHFAFFRGYLDGIDLRQLSARYIEIDSTFERRNDLGKAKTLLAWIMEQLTLTARRAGRTSSIRLIRMAPEKLVDHGLVDVPGLEEFREERDPHRIFSERELLQLFEAEYGHLLVHSRGRQCARNKRLRDRQITLLAHLETLVRADPSLGDRVDGWLDPAIARRLLDMGITTVNDLVNMIEAHGFRWYTKVPRIGIKAATIIREWLLMPETVHALGVSLSLRSMRPRKHIDAAIALGLPRRTSIVPLERFDFPDALKGTSGTNRGPRSRLVAQNDLEAINAWLKLKELKINTFRAYRREAERFLLWSVIEKDKALSSLMTNDCISYRDFLSGIGRESVEQWSKRFRVPQSEWIGQRGIDRFSTRWRPFEGALSITSQKTAVVILHGMMHWLHDQDYLIANPFNNIRNVKQRHGSIAKARGLSPEGWTCLEKQLVLMEQDGRTLRLRLIFDMACSTGRSMSELANLKRGNFRFWSDNTTNRTALELIGERTSTAASITLLSHSLNQQLDHYFRQRGHFSFLDAPMHAPLLTHHDLLRPMPFTTVSNGFALAEPTLSAARIYKILKAFFTDTALAMERNRPELAAKYRSMSPNWLKQRFATDRTNKARDC